MADTADLCRCGMELDKLDKLSELTLQCPRCQARYTKQNDMFVRESPPPSRPEE